MLPTVAQLAERRTVETAVILRSLVRIRPVGVFFKHPPFDPLFEHGCKDGLAKEGDDRRVDGDMINYITVWPCVPA